MVKKEIVQEVSSGKFSEIIKDKKNTLLVCDFYAEWCMPCLMMAPVIESIAQRNSQVKFIKVNVDEAGDLAQQFQISSIPCIVFFKSGEEVDRIVGGVEEGYLEDKIIDYAK